MDFKIAKSEPDKMLVFGWASIAQDINRNEIVDVQGDVVSPEELEDGAYAYVLKFRDTGVEHKDSLRKKGKLVESVVFTPEKQEAMGIPEGILPVGWWVGFKITDDTTWRLIKEGKLKMFSIQGSGNRKKVAKNQPYLDFADGLNITLQSDREEAKTPYSSFNEVIQLS